MFEDELILEFVIFCLAESDACPVEVFLDGVAVVFEAIGFAFVEVDVVFGGGVAVDAVGYLLLELPLHVHR